MKNPTNKPRYVTRGNVLDDLGFSPEQATALKFKAELYQAILKYAQNYSQKELQAILGEPQPRVSELLNGKIANKSVDKLLYYAGRLGIEARTKFSQTRKEVVDRELATADVTGWHASFDAPDPEINRPTPLQTWLAGRIQLGDACRLRYESAGFAGH